MRSIHYLGKDGTCQAKGCHKRRSKLQQIGRTWEQLAYGGDESAACNSR